MSGETADELYLLPPTDSPDGADTFLLISDQRRHGGGFTVDPSFDFDIVLLPFSLEVSTRHYCGG